jgi:hypothetical protein
VSNHLAVATVSAALRNLVDDVAGSVLSGVATNVETGRPDRLVPPDNEAAISIFLYQVTQNPHWSNDDLPTRRGDGSLGRKPQVALDLYYLLTFFGVENRQHPEQLLGRVAGALHAEPILTRERIANVLAADTHLAQSDLASQPELVRFIPIELNLEELSKLWSVFFQTHYRLSVAYKGSVVLQGLRGAGLARGCRSAPEPPGCGAQSLRGHPRAPQGRIRGCRGRACHTVGHRRHPGRSRAQSAGRRHPGAGG